VDFPARRVHVCTGSFLFWLADGHRDRLGHFWGDHWAHVSGGLARHWSSQTMAVLTA